MRTAINHPELFATVFESITKSKLHRPITGLSTDSREIKEGDLYIAINGNRVNGHQFLNEVMRAGAVAALVCDINENIDIQQIRVPNTLNAISEIASKWRMKFDIPVIGITGSNGKTSTKELLSHVLSSKFKMHATKGNFNTKIGLPLTLLGIEKNHDISILEMGASVPGEIEALCQLAKPTHGVITNIAPAHLEGFGSIETIAYEKGALFRSLDKGISFVNKADEMVSKIKFSGKRITYGLSPDCDFPVDIFHERDGSLTLVLDSNVIKTLSYNFSFIKNCVAVSAISISLGIELESLRSRIQSFSAPEGRCFVKQVKDITIIDDTYNANLTSSLAALDYLSAFSGDGRKIFVFGDMFELGPTTDEQHQKVGERCLELNLDGVFTIGEHTRHTNSMINNGMMSKHFKNKKDLIITLQKIIEGGDKILFKGSRGMEMDKIIKGVFNN